MKEKNEGGEADNGTEKDREGGEAGAEGSENEVSGAGSRLVSEWSLNGL